MMFKLSKSSFIFFKILYSIYRTCKYSETECGFILNDDPTSLLATIREKDGLTYIRFTIPIVEDTFYEYPLTPYKESLQEKLDIVQSTELHMRPYIINDSIQRKVNPLYISDIAVSSDAMLIDVLFINSPMAYFISGINKTIPTI